MDIKPVATRLHSDLGVNQTAEQPPAKPGTTQTNPDNTNSTSDLSLTDAAKNLLDIQSSAEQIDDVDLNKVEAIRQAIEDGSYEIDSAQLADNLIKSSLELP